MKDFSPHTIELDTAKAEFLEKIRDLRVAGYRQGGPLPDQLRARTPGQARRDLQRGALHRLLIVAAR
jgi:hypothetical protein